jgi:hypothetical protein
LKKITGYLPKYQAYIRSLKNEGFNVIGYIRKSPTNDSQNRIRLLRCMVDGLKERSLVDKVLASVCCYANDPITQRDLKKKS